MFTNDGVKSVNYFEFESYKKGGNSTTKELPSS